MGNHWAAHGLASTLRCVEIPAPESDLLDDAARPPSPVQVVAALKRLLDSDELRSSARSRAFLAYVVTETLGGRGDRLKERTVARYALGRSGSFDATTNATARVQATRLRAAMQSYYAGPGADEPLVIEVPKGSYVPIFSYRGSPPAGHDDAPLRPGIVVVQFADLRSADRRDQVAVALSHALVRALSAFPDLRIVGPVVAETGPAEPVDVRVLARSLDVEYVLAGSVHAAEDVLRVTCWVCDGLSGDVLWSDRQDQARQGLPGFVEEDGLVGRIAATVGDVRGVVRREVEKHYAGAPGTAVVSAVLAFYRYADSGSRENTLVAQRELMAALEVDPENVVLLSMAGWVQCALGIMGWFADRDVAIGTAEDLAGRALALDPVNAHAHQVLAGVALFRGVDEQCRRYALRAVELNPVNASLLYTSGVLLTHVGDWQGGLEMIREATRLNPYHPGYQHVFLGMDRLFAGDGAGALAEVSLFRQPDDLWGPLLRCLALADLGYDEAAVRELDAALTIEPRLLDDDAALVTDTLLDAPARARAEVRRRLLAWTRSHGVGRLRPVEGDQPGSGSNA